MTHHADTKGAEAVLNSLISEKPAAEYHPAAAAQMLAVAETYLAQTDRLIYSYGSKTFLSGYALYDDAYGGRGNIDCSTFVLLVLAGIPYEESPYASGTARGLRAKDLPWTQKELADFSHIPARYVGIAERIGRPYLAGPKGLDLEKAEAMGITPEMLAEEVMQSGMERRSVTIASYFMKKGTCFSDASFLCPGDLAFFRSEEFYRFGNRTFREKAEVSHVGIVSEDPAFMIHCSGYLDKNRALDNGLSAVSRAALYGRRTPSFFARCS